MSERLPIDALEALANALLLSVAPGRISSIDVVDDEVWVRSALASPFPGERTPSLWLTRLSRVDGHTIHSEPYELSVLRDPSPSTDRPASAQTIPAAQPISPKEA